MREATAGTRVTSPVVERLAALESEGTGVAVVIGGSMPMVPNAVVRGGEVELPDGVRVRTPTLDPHRHGGKPPAGRGRIRPPAGGGRRARTARRHHRSGRGWADDIADQITTEVLAVVQRSAEAHERLGDAAAVRRALEVGVLADPGNESIWRQLLRAVEDTEGPDAARACATRMRTAIDRVAGRFEPFEPETEALVARLQAAARESA